MPKINNRGAALNYVAWTAPEEVHCADKNTPGDKLSSADDYLAQLAAAKSEAEIFDIARAYSGHRWSVEIPILSNYAYSMSSLNDPALKGEYFVFEHSIGTIPKCRMAMERECMDQVKQEAHAKRVVVNARPVKDRLEYDQTGGARLVFFA